MFLTLADGSRIPVVAIGGFSLCFESRVLILDDCLYVPNVRWNLISNFSQTECWNHWSG